MPARWTRSVVLVCLIGFSSLGFSQTNGLLQRGYAVISMESSDPAGLVAVGTFFQQTTAGLFQAEVSTGPLVTSAAFRVNTGTPPDAATGIAIVNPSASAANVRLSVTDFQGIEILNQLLTILPRAQYASFVSEIPGQATAFPTQIGLLRITSDVPVAVLGLNFRQSEFESAAITILAAPPSLTVLPGFPGPNVNVQAVKMAPVTETAIFPQVVNGAGWTTEITVANSTNVAKTVRIEVFDPNGVLLTSSTDLLVPARGLFVYSSRAAGIIMPK